MFYFLCEAEVCSHDLSFRFRILYFIQPVMSLRYSRWRTVTYRWGCSVNTQRRSSTQWRPHTIRRCRRSSETTIKAESSRLTMLKCIRWPGAAMEGDWRPDHSTKPRACSSWKKTDWWGLVYHLHSFQRELYKLFIYVNYYYSYRVFRQL